MKLEPFSKNNPIKKIFFGFFEVKRISLGSKIASELNNQFSKFQNKNFFQQTVNLCKSVRKSRNRKTARPVLHRQFVRNSRRPRWRNGGLSSEIFRSRPRKRIYKMCVPILDHSLKLCCRRRRKTRRRRLDSDLFRWAKKLIFIFFFNFEN